MTTVGNLLDPLQRQNRFNFNRGDSKVYFLTYKNEKWSAYCDKLVQQAEGLNYFDKCIVESNIEKDLEFCDTLKNSTFKSNYELKKGCGLWLWKPYIINKQLQKINNGDFLIYSDPWGAFPNNPILKCWSKNKLNFYLNLLDEKKCLSFSSGFQQYKTTKDSVFKYFNYLECIGAYLGESRISGLHFIKKCDFTNNLYKHWWIIAKNNSSLFNDCLCKNGYNFHFVENRNDEAVWSLLCKKYDVELVEDKPSDRPIKISTRPIIENDFSFNIN